ncbi:hypothetical protein GCM10009760_38060 [Kitasatospora kazusensis]|uniref:Histidine kinase/HSP90-like ATPase domain-containing protein n=1 Tax=Kitasatospora kazusensis TaxID=407974 RepID=A0ABN2ZTJ8_9ACTN
MPGMLARPPADAGEDSRWLPYTPSAPRAARQLLRDLLADLDGGERYAETGELLLSELVTNAVTHAKSRGHLLWVRLELYAGSLRIEVHDAGEGRPVVRSVGGDDERGRGLLLVRELAESWGCCPRAGGVGKFTWCTVAPVAGGAR